MAALGAMLTRDGGGCVYRHVEGSQRVLYARRTIKIEYSALDGIMLIGSGPSGLVRSLPVPLTARGRHTRTHIHTDPNTAINLELTNSLQEGGAAKTKKATLFGVLNQTSTPMGGTAVAVIAARACVDFTHRQAVVSRQQRDCCGRRSCSRRQVRVIKRQHAFARPTRPCPDA
jgi:hypothetical protein